jgi:two-component system cell cycle response regulator DivK
MASTASGSGGAATLPVILLVEDHQDTRQMYAEFLSASFEVLSAPDGAAALEILRTARPTLMITDLSLPGMDGLELVSAVRKDPRFTTLPIVCLSGYGGHAHEQRARAAGCDRILQKPCLPDALLDIALELVFSRQREVS